MYQQTVLEAAAAAAAHGGRDPDAEEDMLADVEGLAEEDWLAEVESLAESERLAEVEGLAGPESVMRLQRAPIAAQLISASPPGWLQSPILVACPRGRWQAVQLCSLWFTG